MPYCSKHKNTYVDICYWCYNDSKLSGDTGSVPPPTPDTPAPDKDSNLAGDTGSVPPPTPDTPAPDKAEVLLKEALTIVTGARRQSYGNPEDNFAVIAGLWGTYLGKRHGSPFTLTAGDVAVMMVLMKCARLAETPDHHDSALDIAGYAACLARCQGATK